MIKLYWRFIVALGIGLCLGSAAMAAPKPAPISPKSAAEQSGSPIGVTLGIDKLTYTHADTKIHAVMTLFNHTQTPLVFMEHGRKFDWQILDAQGNVVWDYAKGRMFPHNVIRRSLTQGHLDYAFDVPLTGQDGQPLPPGNYTLRGQLAISPPMGGEIGFTITGAPKGG